MGLDNYWEKEANNVKVKDEKLEGLHIVGGMMSGNGNGSFRGKCYSSLIQTLSGKSLYEELTNDDCKEVWNAIKDVTWEEAKEADDRIGEQEWTDFKTMWNYYTERGFKLRAWY